MAEVLQGAAWIGVGIGIFLSMGLLRQWKRRKNKGLLIVLLMGVAFSWLPDNDLVSVTILSDLSVDGDGLSTSCYALGLEKGMKLIESLPDTEALFVTNDEELHYSSGFPR